MREEIETGIGDIPEEGIYGISPTIDGDLLEVNWVAPQKGGGITRRQFVTGASAAGGLLVLAGCVPATETPPTATRTPEEVGITLTPEVVPTYTPRPSPEASPSPTATEEPTATPEPTATSEPTPTLEPTPTQEPTATPTPEIPTPTPTQEIQPSPEICDVTGLCHLRTERRKGMKPDGHVFPNGLCYRYTGDPDRNFQGLWVISGRITEVVNANRGEFKMNVGRGEETVLIDVKWMQDQPEDPNKYSHARLWTFQLGVPWNIDTPEVCPRLGRDLIVGDYLQIRPAVVGIKNHFTEEQNYQIIVKAATHGIVPTYRLEMIQ